MLNSFMKREENFILHNDKENFTNEQEYRECFDKIWRSVCLNNKYPATEDRIKWGHLQKSDHSYFPRVCMGSNESSDRRFWWKWWKAATSDEM